MGRAGAFDEVTGEGLDGTDIVGGKTGGIDAALEALHPPPPAWQQLGTADEDGRDGIDEYEGKPATTEFTVEA